jgi:hypothetical protein
MNSNRQHGIQAKTMYSKKTAATEADMWPHLEEGQQRLLLLHV